MASKSIGMLNIVFGANLKGFDKAMKKAQRSIKKFGSSMKRVGGNLSRSVTMPILALGGASVKMALGFEKSMTKVNTLVGVSKEEVEKLKKSVLELSGKTATAPNELAEGLYFLTSAGLSGVDAMEALEQVAKGVAAGLGESADLANVAAAAQNAYGKDTMSASKALDIFGGMVKTGMFNAADLSKVLGQQLGLAAALGISFEEVGAMISTYTKTTGDANSATTGLSGVMMSFAKITPKQEKALTDVNMSVKGLKESLSKRGLQATLLEMQKKFKLNGVEMSEFFSKSSSLKAVLGVLGKQTETYKDILMDLEGSLGFVNKAFDETAKTSSFKMEKALNDLRVAGTMLGQELFPIVDALGKKISELANWFSNLDDEGKKSFVMWAGVAAAIGPVLMIFGQMSIGVSYLLPLIAKLGTAMLGLISAHPVLMAIATALALISPFIIHAIIDTNKWKDAMGAVNRVQATAISKSKAQRLVLDKLTSTVLDQNVAVEDQEKALHELKKLSKKHYGDLTLATVNQENLTLATKNYKLELIAVAKAAAGKAKLEQLAITLGEKEALLNQQLKDSMKDLIEIYKGMGKESGEALRMAAETMSVRTEDLRQEITDIGVQMDKLSTVMAKDILSGDIILPDSDLPDKEEEETEDDEATKKIKAAKALAKAIKEQVLADIKSHEDLISTKIKLEEDYYQSLLTQQQQELNAVEDKYFAIIEAANEAGLDTIDLENAKAAEIDKIIKDAAQRKIKEEEAAAEESIRITQEELDEKMEGWNKFAATVGKILNSIGGLMSAQSEKEQAEFDIWKEEQDEKVEVLDTELATKLERVEESNMSDEDKAERKIAIEKEYSVQKDAIDDLVDNKERAMKKKQATRDKAMKLASAIMSTAEAVAANIAIPPLAAFIGMLGAMQIATIASTPIPFAMGGLVSGPTLGLLGEGSGTSAMNPEVVAPLDKLMGMMGGTVDVHGRIQGNNIILVSDKAEISRERFI